MGDQEVTANMYICIHKYVILRICIGKVTWFAVYFCGNFWVTQYTWQVYMHNIRSKVSRNVIEEKWWGVLLMTRNTWMCYRNWFNSSLLDHITHSNGIVCLLSSSMMRWWKEWIIPHLLFAWGKPSFHTFPHLFV